MKCPTDLTIMMRADQELDALESRRVDEHVGGCARCRELLFAMRAERHVLASALHEAVAGRPVPAGSDASAVRRRWSDVGSLGVAVSLVVALAAVTVSPFHPSALAMLLFAAVTFLVFEGVGVLASLARVVGPPTAAIGLLLVVVALARAVRRPAATGLGIVLFGMMAAPGEAFVVRQSDRVVVVPADETVDDTLVTTGDRIIVEGTVVGDLVAVAAERLEIRGVVRGNVLAAGRYVDVDGEVGGSVFASCEAVRVRGRVDGNLYALAQRARVLEGGRIGGSVASYGGTATIGGTVERSVRAAGGHVEVAGTVRRDVSATAERVTVGPRARIAGSLTARVPEAASLRIDPGAALSGPPDVVRNDETSLRRYLTASFYVGEVLWLLAALVTGGALFRLSPGAADLRFESPIAALKALCLGSLCVLAIPVVAVVGIALVGLPAAAAALGVLAVGLYLAKIVVAMFLGRAVVGTNGPGGLPAALVVGLTTVLVAVNLPFVGWLINVTLTLIGAGALCAWIVDAFRAGVHRPDSTAREGREAPYVAPSVMNGRSGS
ncbi:MAG: zf-HC2 domain-containing protein [Acidobacteria bacterium]|nr:zf-HC2 domain-containing protein [Acidobacteriota bacterium]